MARMGVARRAIIQRNVAMKMILHQPLTARERRVYEQDIQAINTTSSLILITSFPMQVMSFGALLFGPR